jgi:uncharacterized protein (DUF2267 family)
MSQQGLEVIESSTQKTHEWINDIADTAHLEKRDAFKALRAVLHALRDRLSLHDAVHFAAQLPTFVRGLFYDGWQPAKVPIKMSREEFLSLVQADVVTDDIVDPLRMTEAVLLTTMNYVDAGEMDKVRHCLPKDMQALSPDGAAVGQQPSPTDTTHLTGEPRSKSMARSTQGSGKRTKGKGGGTSRQRARGGSQRGGGTKKSGVSKGSRARRGSGGSGGGGGQRSTGSAPKSSTRTGSRKASTHAPAKAGQAQSTGSNRENAGGVDASGESRVRGEP